MPSHYDRSWVERRAGECRIREATLREYVAAEEEYAFTNEGMAFWRTIADTVDQCMAGVTTP